MVVNEYPLYTVTCSQSLFYMPDLQRDIYKTHTSTLLIKCVAKNYFIYNKISFVHFTLVHPGSDFACFAYKLRREGGSFSSLKSKRGLVGIKPATVMNEPKKRFSNHVLKLTITI